MPIIPDIFDILDVSTNEDSYSRLIVEVLRRYPALCNAVVRALSIIVPTGESKIVFRGSIGGKGNKPDIRIVSPTANGPWWTVFENKILAEEGHWQCRRYCNACEEERLAGRIAGFTLYYLTLRGGSSDPNCRPLTYKKLMDLVKAEGFEEALFADPLLGTPWRAFLNRLRLFEELRGPADETLLLDWMHQPDQGFVTAEARARLLGEILLPGGCGYAREGALYTSAGHQQMLVSAWKKEWNTSTGKPVQNIAESVSVHFELDIPWPFGGGRITCHLHCETAPYRTRKDLERMGPEADPFRTFLSSFTSEIHGRLAGTGWLPSSRPLQRARAILTLTPTMTVEEFRMEFLSRLDAVKNQVTEAMMEAGRRQGLSWAKQEERTGAV